MQTSALYCVSWRAFFINYWCPTEKPADVSGTHSEFTDASSATESHSKVQGASTCFSISTEIPQAHDRSVPHQRGTDCGMMSAEKPLHQPRCTVELQTHRGKSIGLGTLSAQSITALLSSRKHQGDLQERWIQEDLQRWNFCSVSSHSVVTTWNYRGFFFSKMLLMHVDIVLQDPTLWPQWLERERLQQKIWKTFKE